MKKDNVREEVSNYVVQLMTEAGITVNYDKLSAILDKHKVSRQSWIESDPEEKYIGKTAALIYTEMI